MATRYDSSAVLIVPDLHAPYHLPGSFDFLADVAKLCRPSLVVCIGDEIDAHTVSRYAHDPNLPGPKSELRQARKALKKLFALFPRAISCESNHTFRAYARAHDAGIPRDYLRPIREVLDAPLGWEWSQSWDVDGVRYSHGEGYGSTSPARAAAMRNRQSSVVGHIHHAAGVEWLHGWKDRVFGMSVGCLIDPNHAAFNYAKASAARPALGCAWIVGGVPTFLPLTEKYL